MYFLLLIAPRSLWLVLSTFRHYLCKAYGQQAPTYTDVCHIYPWHVLNVIIYLADLFTVLGRKSRTHFLSIFDGVLVLFTWKMVCIHYQKPKFIQFWQFLTMTKCSLLEPTQPPRYQGRVRIAGANINYGNHDNLSFSLRQGKRERHGNSWADEGTRGN